MQFTNNKVSLNVLCKFYHARKASQQMKRFLQPQQYFKNVIARWFTNDVHLAICLHNFWFHNKFHWNYELNSTLFSYFPLFLVLYPSIQSVNSSTMLKMYQISILNFLDVWWDIVWGYSMYIVSKNALARPRRWQLLNKTAQMYSFRQNYLWWIACV